jgi:adenylate cyclase
MAIEIERKFLVRGEGWRPLVESSHTLAQAYLGGDRGSVRVRVDGSRAFLNIKARVRGTRRLEFEYPIPLHDADVMLRELAGAEVTKIRHHVRHAGHLWEIDEFGGANAGLIVAEIELGDVAEAFERPDWLGREVSDDSRFYNAALADAPFSGWADRASILQELAC